MTPTSVSFTQVLHLEKRRTGITGLINEEGDWVQIDEGIQRVAVDYFKALFYDSIGKYDEVLNCVDNRVMNEENDALLPFSKDEFKEVVMQMHADKSPGPDGFNPAFYQRFWDLVGDDI